MRSCVSIASVSDAAPTPVVTGYEGVRFNTPNDLVFRSDGQIYLSDPDYQAPASRPQAAGARTTWTSKGSCG
ncbi:MAG: hypothetical protein R3B99_32585 [Polyangiales bacterium]